MADKILQAIHSKFKGTCDVLHVHNPTLAKNLSFQKILKSLAQKNTKLFLQIHDFAEDGRPAAYFAEDYVADCHYGVINSRDYDILLKAGLKKEGLHKIFNTIHPREPKSRCDRPSSSVLYPIRAIRRKNIGEAILLSLFFRSGESLAITLPPNSPADYKSYEGWKAFAEQQHLRVEFEKGLNRDFKKLVDSAKYLITTSINEGFGFSFLEPWLYAKLLWGRKLSGICHDFEKNGVLLDHLYLKLLIPVEWVGYDELYQQWRSWVLKTCALFQFPIAEPHLKASFENLTAQGTIDFGLLHESFQKQIIIRILRRKKNAERMRELNPFLVRPGEVPDQMVLIQNNRRAVLDNYNPSLYRQQLLKIYEVVCQTDIEQKIDKKVLLAAFLDLNEFSLLKWSEYHD
ncbi:MAG: hypothetical protein JSW39_06030 [Desulfobacterales bacterium]|nr:MAG: hypothetical protein JSW39_06030 [Desulfobacterales bacterium]